MMETYGMESSYGKSLTFKDDVCAQEQQSVRSRRDFGRCDCAKRRVCGVGGVQFGRGLPDCNVRRSGINRFDRHRRDAVAATPNRDAHRDVYSDEHLYGNGDEYARADRYSDDDSDTDVHGYTNPDAHPY